MFKVIKYSVKYGVDTFNHDDPFVPVEIVEAADKAALMGIGERLGAVIIENKDKLPISIVDEVDDSSLVGQKKITVSIALVDEDEYYRLKYQDEILEELRVLLNNYENSDPTELLSDLYTKALVIVEKVIKIAR